RPCSFGTVWFGGGFMGGAAVGTVSAAPDMPAWGCGAEDFVCGHYAPRAEAQMSLVGGAPSGAVAAENIRHFELWTGHRRRVNPALSLPCSGVRVGFEPAGSCRSQRAHSPRST